MNNLELTVNQIKQLQDTGKVVMKVEMKPQPDIPTGSKLNVGLDGQGWGKNEDEDNEAPMHPLYYEGKIFESPFKEGEEYKAAEMIMTCTKVTIKEDPWRFVGEFELN